MYSWNQIKRFFSRDIWRIDDTELTLLQRIGIRLSRRLMITGEGFMDNNLTSYASALTDAWTQISFPISIQAETDYGATVKSAQGEFLAARAASPVWEVLAGRGLGLEEWPAPYDAAFASPPFGYVRRTGTHGLSPDDWRWAMDFAESNGESTRKPPSCP